MARSAKQSRSTSIVLQKLVTETSGFILKAEASLGSEPLSLTALEKRHAAKFRKGGDKVVQTVGSLAEQHGMDSASLDSATMLARLDDARALAPLRKRVERVLKRLDDMIFHAHADSWRAALEFYALMQRRATTDGDLAVGRASVESFCASRRRAASAGKPTKRQRQRQREAKARAALKLLGITQEQTTKPATPAPPPTLEGTSSHAPSASSGVNGINGVVNGLNGAGHA